MKNGIFFLLIVNVLVSCKPEPLDINIKQAPEKLSFSNQYLGDGLFGVVMSKSFSGLKQPFRAGDSTQMIDSSLLISGASIRLIGSNVALTLEPLSTGIYGVNQLNLIDGEKYRMEANHPVLGSIWAEAVKMEKVRFDSINFEVTEDDKNIDLHFSFTENQSTKNYYVVNYLLVKKDEPIPNKPDPEYISRRIFEQQARFDLFSDADAVNGKIEVKRKLLNQGISDSLWLSLSHISEEYYHFLEAQRRGGTLFNQLRGEVINYPSNIHNGYGFFSLHEPDIILTRRIKVR
ncbi:MAG: DUF4249 family protein [Bacteroidota bacterium]|nr:DUF4249 family protein [Bacteroidota bacterium]